MKKAGLLILILLTAYIGGIYEDPALILPPDMELRVRLEEAGAGR